MTCTHTLEDSVSQQGIDRRTVIRSAGVVGVVGAAGLAACGGGGETSGSAIKIADIPVGGGKVFEAEKVVVTQPKAGEIKAFSAICTHKGCTVSGVVNGAIFCPCHASTFDMATGEVTGGPATVPLPGKSVTVSRGSITIT